ncbi:MAG: class 1 fructose-bisphosphatase [Janthinobacterium lividum]
MSETSRRSKMERITIDEWVADSARPNLSDVFRAVAAAAAEIAKKIRLAGLDDLYGEAGATNVQGEQQQKLDVFANETLTKQLRNCLEVAGVVSEEDEAPVLFAREEHREEERFAVCFDPLDGSSNIDVNVNVGTIFGVRALPEGTQNLAETVLRPGLEQVAAGYVVYGPSVIFVATVGDGVAAFTLNDSGEFVQSAENMRMPEQGPYYSANEASAESWSEGFRDFIPALLRGELGDKPYSARYIGSLVADFHRTLLKGGVFLYPASKKAPEGKLRLQYEANPLAMLAEAAGGAAVNGSKRILEIEATSIHGRTPLVVGSRREVDLLQRLVREAQA